MRTITLALVFGAFSAAGCGGKDEPTDTGDTDTDTDTDSDTDTDTDSDTDADTDTDTDTDTDSDTDTDTDTDDTGATSTWSLQACPGNPPDDAVSVFDPTTQVAVVGTELVVSLGYGCGCTNHVLNSCFGPSFGGASPPTLDVAIVHDANNEMCDAFCYDEVRVDLVPVQQQYAASYGGKTGTLDLVVRWDGNSGPEQVVVPFAW